MVFSIGIIYGVFLHNCSILVRYNEAIQCLGLATPTVTIISSYSSDHMNNTLSRKIERTVNLDADDA